MIWGTCRLSQPRVHGDGHDGLSRIRVRRRVHDAQRNRSHVVEPRWRAGGDTGRSLVQSGDGPVQSSAASIPMGRPGTSATIPLDGSRRTRTRAIRSSREDGSTPTRGTPRPWTSSYPPGRFTWSPGRNGEITAVFVAASGLDRWDAVRRLRERAKVLKSQAPPPNRAPLADADGPYTGFAGIPIEFDGSASSDPDGNALDVHLAVRGRRGR